MTNIGAGAGGDKELAQLKRDLARTLSSMPKMTKKKLDAPYAEPMYLGFDHRPEGLLLVSCIDAQYQEEPENVLCGGMCHWTYDGGQKRIRIISIDGLTPSSTRTFRFLFLVVG